MIPESALAAGVFRTSYCLSYTISSSPGPLWSCLGADDPVCFSNFPTHIRCRRTVAHSTPQRGTLHQALDLDNSWNRLQRLNDGYSFMTKNNLLKTKVQATSDHLDSVSGPQQCNEKQCYHPSEEITESDMQSKEEPRLTDAEMTRTIIEVNSKATIMFSGMVNDEVHENIFWPELPYLTNENGDIYFEVNGEEDVLQILNVDDKFVQVLVGLDDIGMFNQMEVSGESNIDFGIEEITDEDSDIDNDYEKDWVAVLEDDEDDLDDISEALGNWANLETMRSCHPMYFAKKMSEVVSTLHMDWMDQPPVGLAIQGHLRPAFIEEQPITSRCMLGETTNSDLSKKLGKVVDESIEGVDGHEPDSDFRMSEELEKDGSLRARTSFYKLEMISVQLVSPYGNQSMVKVKDFRQAQPDILAHSAARIISRLNAGGEKSVHGLKSLCWRIKGIQVEEAALIGVDSVGFDLRVCSGTQVQTLRFAFNTRATSEYGAERQLYDLLFPGVLPHHKQQAPRQQET